MPAVSWTHSTNVTISSGDVDKTSGGTAYNAGASSSIPRLETITFTDFNAGNYNTWAGFSTNTVDNPPLGFTGIFWRQAGASDMRIMSDTTALKTLTHTISPSDTYEIRKEGSIAKFYFNGVEQTGFSNPTFPDPIIPNVIIYQENTGCSGSFTQSAGTLLFPPPVAWI